ncbi:MAG: hypothetical protein JSW57_10065, partial [Flavobacteriaceae bacterium]
SGLNTDDQTLATDGTAGNISIEDGNALTLNVDDADADPTNEYNTGISFDGTNLTVTDAGGDQAVDISGLNTDDQNISGSGLSGTDLTIGIENGTSEIVDLSSLDESVVGTNDITVTEAGGVYTVDYVDGDKDSTNEIQDLNLATNTLTITNNASATPIDLSPYLDNTDDQTAAEVSYDNLASGLTATNTQAAIDELAGLTDDDVSVTNTIAGNTIATISEPGIAAVNINETVTTLSTLDGETYTYTSEANVGTSFVGTDDQTAAEVNLVSASDSDGDGVNETTVEEVVTAIAPITAKAARIFYPPSIAIDASTNGVGFTVDLYQQYLDQFGTPAVSSPGAPAAVPTYGPTELYYYVTYADPGVFSGMSIDANGVLTYNIIGQPSDYNSLINVVFVVK